MNLYQPILIFPTRCETRRQGQVISATMKIDQNIWSQELQFLSTCSPVLCCANIQVPLHLGSRCPILVSTIMISNCLNPSEKRTHKACQFNTVRIMYFSWHIQQRSYLKTYLKQKPTCDRYVFLCFWKSHLEVIIFPQVYTNESLLFGNSYGDNALTIFPDRSS